VRVDYISPVRARGERGGRLRAAVLGPYLIVRPRKDSKQKKLERVERCFAFFNPL